MLSRALSSLCLAPAVAWVPSTFLQPPSRFNLQRCNAGKGGLADAINLDGAEVLGQGTYGEVLTLCGDSGEQYVVKRAKPNTSGEKYLAREAVVNSHLFGKGSASLAPPLDSFLAPYLGESKDKLTGAPVLVWAHCGTTRTLRDYLEDAQEWQPTTTPTAPETGSSSAVGAVTGSGTGSGRLCALAAALGVPENDVAWEVLAQLSLAIAALHDQGVLHRDIKPENILVDHSTRTLRLIDLGSAALMNAPPWSPGALTAGTLACSPSYTAPEAQRDQHGDQKAFDAYGLGAVWARLVWPHLTTEEDAMIFVGQLAGAGHNLDTWLGRRLGATLVDARLNEGLAHFNAATKSNIAPGSTSGAAASANAVPNTSVNAEDATATSFGLGPLGWRILRGLLKGDPSQRLTVNQVRAASSRLMWPRALPLPSTTTAGGSYLMPAVGGQQTTQALPRKVDTVDESSNDSIDSCSSSSSPSSLSLEEDGDACPVYELAQLEEVFHVSLGKPLGLVFEEVAPGQRRGVRVAEISEKGAADRSGAVQPGDVLIALGAKAVHRQSFDEVMDRLRFSTGSKSLPLAFRRPACPESTARTLEAATSARETYAAVAGSASKQSVTTAASASRASGVVSAGACAQQGLRYAMEDRVFLATESSLALSSPEEAVTTTPFDARWLSRSKNGIDSDSDSASSGNSASGSAVVAVFDGHAGSGGADFCARKLPTALEATSLKPPAGRSEQQQQQAPWLKSLASALAPAGIGAVATTSNAATATDAASSGADSSSSSVVPPSKTSSAAVAAVAGAWRVLCEQWGNGDGSGAVATIAMVTPDIDNDHDDDAATAGSDSRGVVVAVANCGDSRAVLLEFTEPFGAAQQSKKSAPSSANTRAPPAAPVIVAAQTADHRTDNPDELARLTKAGGKVACDRGTIRIVAGDWRLAVPRALTSKMWRQAGVSDAADVYCWQLFAESQDTPSSQHNGNYRAPGYALVVASDGVWGTLAASDAARLVGQYWGKGVGAQTAADALCASASELGSSDNLSAGIVYIKG